MKFISQIKSLVKFNFRVLYEGKLDKTVKSIEEIHNKLKFNLIFLSNMAEVYQKYPVEEIKTIVELYNNGLKVYNNNIKDIINQLNLYKNINIDLNSSINLSLKELKRVDLSNLSLKNNQIYYLTVINNSKVIINYLVNTNSIIKNIEKYFNLSYSIAKTIQSVTHGETIWFKVQSNDHTKSIIKIEVSSKLAKFIEIFRKIFGNDVILFENNMLDITNLDQYIKTLYKKDEIKPKEIEISIEKLFKQDILIQFPEISFISYINFLKECAENINVRIIFMTIYRIGYNDEILKVLSKAVSNGIRVYVNIELNAYGEKINQLWKEKFQNAGIKVLFYGKDYFKIHSKVTFVMFNSGKIITQIGTGNFHSETTKQYTDLMLFTTNNLIGTATMRLVQLILNKDFSFKTGTSVLVTRFNFKKVFIKKINHEIEKGSNGLIIFKCNSFNDSEIFIKIFEAVKAGVKVILIVRGIFTWVPVKKYPNLIIKSVIWDKLEHSRVYWFGNLQSTCYIGSLDLVENKVRKRIETLVEVTDESIKCQISKYLCGYIADYDNSWIMDCNGNYIKRKRKVKDGQK